MFTWWGGRGGWDFHTMCYSISQAKALKMNYFIYLLECSHFIELQPIETVNIMM